VTPLLGNEGKNKRQGMQNEYKFSSPRSSPTIGEEVNTKRRYR
jgi:hypothetical protein